jgi:hypothetical protein
MPPVLTRYVAVAGICRAAQLARTTWATTARRRKVQTPRDLSDSQADSSSSELALSPHGRPLPFHLVCFAGCNYLRSELYSAITLALGQQVVPGNQLLL